MQFFSHNIRSAFVIPHGPFHLNWVFIHDYYSGILRRLLSLRREPIFIFYVRETRLFGSLTQVETNTVYLVFFFYFLVVLMPEWRWKPAPTCSTRSAERKSNFSASVQGEQKKIVSCIKWLLLFSCAGLDTGRVTRLQCIRRCGYVPWIGVVLCWK